MELDTAALDFYTTPPYDEPEEKGGTEVVEVKKASIKRHSLEAATSIEEKFIVAGQVGSGGLAIVYELLSSDGNQALKMFHSSDHAPTDEWLMDCFVSESAIHQKLHHRHIPEFYGIGGVDGGMYIRMEFIEGKDLSTMIDEEDIDPIDAVKYCLDVAETLEYIHRQGYIHRDIKPENILITPKGEAYLIDFSLMVPKEHYNNGENLGVVEGSRGYLSPEQLRAEALDFRTDIFSLGKTLYSCLEGKEPVIGDINQELNFVPELVSTFGKPGITKGWNNIVDQLLAHNRDHRYSSARDARLALKLLLPASLEKTKKRSFKTTKLFRRLLTFNQT